MGRASRSHAGGHIGSVTEVAVTIACSPSSRPRGRGARRCAGCLRRRAYMVALRFLLIVIDLVVARKPAGRRSRHRAKNRPSARQSADGVQHPGIRDGPRKPLEWPTACVERRAERLARLAVAAATSAKSEKRKAAQAANTALRYSAARQISDRLTCNCGFSMTGNCPSDRAATVGNYA